MIINRYIRSLCLRDMLSTSTVAEICRISTAAFSHKLSGASNWNMFHLYCLSGVFRDLDFNRIADAEDPTCGSIPCLSWPQAVALRRAFPALDLNLLASLSAGHVDGRRKR